MNRNIRRLGLFFLVAFAVILLDVTYWQVIDASSLVSRPDNSRLIGQAEHVRRGLIFDRTGALLAGRRIDANGVVHRYYTDPALSEVIGYDSLRYGKTEIERSYDKYLSGQVAGTSWQSVINAWEHKPVVGDNLTLTIDRQLQDIVTGALPNTPSAAIVADPRTGQILAMASKPGFDANQVASPAYWQSLLSAPGHPLINRAAGGYYVPGSTFKILTLSAGVDSGLASISNVYSGPAATGPLDINGYVIPAADNNLNNCGGRAVYPPITLATALACSDNIVFAELGLSLGWSRFLDYTHRFGLGQLPPFDIPVAVSHTRTAGEPMDGPALAATSFGQGGLHVSPLQMLMIDEAIANGGSIPYPSLVQRVTDPNGSTIKSAPGGSLYTPISSASAAQVKQAMIDVVQTGSGLLAQIPGVTVAGKTGTAETGDGLPPHAWFVCFAPADHPRVAVVVLVEHGGEGATVAAPIARTILLAALSRVH